MSASALTAGSRLLLDIKNTSLLLPYQDETVRGVLLDIVSLDGARLESNAGGKVAGLASKTVQESQLRRQKRCLVVYMSARCERIEAVRWNTGTVIPVGTRDALSNDEKDYFRAYGEAVTAYAAAAGVDVLAVSGGGGGGGGGSPSAKCESRP